MAGALMLGLAAIAPASSIVGSWGSGMEVRAAFDRDSPLVASSLRAGRQSGYIVVTGRIRNASARMEREVEVVAELADRGGTPLTQASSLVATTDIGPGGSSSFGVIVNDTSRGRGITVSVRRLRASLLTPPVAFRVALPNGP
jgi:hypothetical protein